MYKDFSGPLGRAWETCEKICILLHYSETYSSKWNDTDVECNKQRMRLEEEGERKGREGERQEDGDTKGRRIRTQRAQSK